MVTILTTTLNKEVSYSELIANQGWDMYYKFDEAAGNFAETVTGSATHEGVPQASVGHRSRVGPKGDDWGVELFETTGWIEWNNNATASLVAGAGKPTTMINIWAFFESNAVVADQLPGGVLYTVAAKEAFNNTGSGRVNMRMDNIADGEWRILLQQQFKFNDQIKNFNWEGLMFSDGWHMLTFILKATCVQPPNDATEENRALNGRFLKIDGGDNLTPTLVTGQGSGSCMDFANMTVTPRTMTGGAERWVADKTEQTAIDFTSHTIVGGDFWTMSTSVTDFYIWYTVDAGGADPGIEGTGALVAILSTDTAAQIATKTKTVIDLLPNINTATATNVLNLFFQIAATDITDAADGNAGIIVTVNIQGGSNLSQFETLIRDGTEISKLSVLSAADDTGLLSDSDILALFEANVS